MQLLKSSVIKATYLALLLVGHQAIAVDLPRDIKPPSQNENWETDEEISILPSVNYCQREDGEANPDDDQHASLYFPEGFENAEANNYPVVIFFHGLGNLHDDIPSKAVAETIARRGYVVISADYSEPNVINPGRKMIKGMADGRCAIRWIRTLAQQEGFEAIDASKIASMGWSYGTNVALSIALSPQGDIDVCVGNNTVVTSTPWQISLHVAKGHNVTWMSPTNSTCTVSISEADWAFSADLVGHTESMWRSDADESVQAFIPVASGVDILSLTTECSILHSDFGAPGHPALPLPIDVNGEPMCSFYKDIKRKHEILLPNTSAIYDGIDGDYFETNMRNIFAVLMGTSFFLDPDDDEIPGDAISLVPYERYISKEMFTALEAWSPTNFLADVGSGDDVGTGNLPLPTPIPSLIIAGKNDLTTVWYSNVAAGVRLKAAGFPAETFIFNDSDHGIIEEKDAHDLGIISFLDNVFGDSPNPEQWYYDACEEIGGEKKIGTTVMNMKCLNELTTVGSGPHILAVNGATQVTYPHKPELDQPYTRVAPIDNNGEYNADTGLYTMYEGMRYDFDALDFQWIDIESKYVNHSASVEWELRNEYGMPESEQPCLGAPSSRASLNIGGPIATDGCKFNLVVGKAYILAATGPNGTTTTTINVLSHPTNGVDGALARIHRIPFFKWLSISWTDHTDTAFPGGRVSLYFDDSETPIKDKVTPSIWNWANTKIADTFKVCYPGTNVCTQGDIPN